MRLNCHRHNCFYFYYSCNEFFCKCSRNWLSTAKRLSTPEEANAFQLDSIEKEISLLEKELSGPSQSMGFCHNDLQYGNIMLEEGSKSITIIVSLSLYLSFLFRFIYISFTCNNGIPSYKTVT